MSGDLNLFLFDHKNEGEVKITDLMYCHIEQRRKLEVGYLIKIDDELWRIVIIYQETTGQTNIFLVRDK